MNVIGTTAPRRRPTWQATAIGIMLAALAVVGASPAEAKKRTFANCQDLSAPLSYHAFQKVPRPRDPSADPFSTRRSSSGSTCTWMSFGTTPRSASGSPR